MPELRVEHLLRLMISIMIVMATMLLGVGGHTIGLTLAAIVAVVASAYLADFGGRFLLTQTMADYVALGVVGVCVVNGLLVDRVGQMQVVADLQSYLQFVLLFQPKTPRVYWQLALLTLGQIAIASTLVTGPMFGIVLVLYVFTGIIAFILLLLYAEARQFGPSPELAMAGNAADQAMVAPPAEASDRSAPAESIRPSRLPILSGGAIVENPARVLWGAVRQAAMIGVVAVVVGMMLFLYLPRRSVKSREVASTEPLRTVGFSKTVTLGELGDVVNNSDVVMRIQFFHGRGQVPFQLAEEPLFRGTVVTHYERGAWTQAATRSIAALPLEIKSPFVRQWIRAEPLDVSELCCIFPVFGLQPDGRVRIDTRSEQLVRQEDYRSRQLDFEIGTTGIVNNRQRKVLPSEARLREDEIQDLLQIPVPEAPRPDPFVGLRATAASVLLEKNIDANDRVAAARALNDYLHTPGRFFYSLESVARDESLDPLEDFVTKHPQGHCEYFAGALAIMLRSQGIPARIAIGFKGGEWNPLGGYYQVQQLHAHAWVEAYLRKDDIPAGTFSDLEATPRAAWLILDPTEGVQESGSAAGRQGFFSELRQFIDFGRVLWANYFVGLNSRRQQQGLYEPLAENAGAAIEGVLSPLAWQTRLRAVANSPLGAFWRWYRGHWFSWRGGLVATGFLLLVVGLYLGTRWLNRALRGAGLVGSQNVGDQRPVLEMYRRLEAALGRHGFRRHPAQTAREFALSAGGDLAGNVEHRRVAHLPRRIVDLFYRVRFGGRTLDNQEADAVESALAELELALRSGS